ncbi:MAG: hypothetical protein NC123_20155 [Butyrivibrio sp.]|nr:hypothetical protein [Butyrivibrio sp.]
MAGNKRLVIILIATMLAAYVPVSQKESVCEVSAAEMAVEENIELVAAEDELPVEEGYETVYFYAYTSMDVPAIELIDEESNQAVGMMVDDADYPMSGDEIKGDGVYTCKVQIDTSQVKEYCFYAQYTGVSGNVVSETVQIEIQKDLTDQDFDDMAEVDKKICALQSDKKYDKLPLKEKEKQMRALLVSLAEKGTKKFPYPLIRKNSIYHDKYTRNFSFTYACGVGGCVIMVEYDDMCNGSAVPDTAAPKTNIKNGKTYKSGKKIIFSDEGSGMKSAKLDGKKIKNGHVVRKKGKHKLVLTDKAGNKRIVKFTITDLKK